MHIIFPGIVPSTLHILIHLLLIRLSHVYSYYILRWEAWGNKGEVMWPLSQSQHVVKFSDPWYSGFGSWLLITKYICFTAKIKIKREPKEAFNMLKLSLCIIAKHSENLIINLVIEMCYSRWSRTACCFLIIICIYNKLKFLNTKLRTVWFLTVCSEFYSKYNKILYETLIA